MTKFCPLCSQEFIASEYIQHDVIKTHTDNNDRLLLILQELIDINERLGMLR